MVGGGCNHLHNVLLLACTAAWEGALKAALGIIPVPRRKKVIDAHTMLIFNSGAENIGFFGRCGVEKVQTHFKRRPARCLQSLTAPKLLDWQMLACVHELGVRERCTRSAQNYMWTSTSSAQYKHHLSAIQALDQHNTT